MEHATISAFEEYIADRLRWSFTFTPLWLGPAEVKPK